jgi:transposase
VAATVMISRKFESTAQSIRNWLARADKKEGRQADAPLGLSAVERDELSRLRRENKQLRVERDILSKAAAWFARETGTLPSRSSGS